MSQFFASGSQSIVASVLASVFLMNIPDWFPLGLTGLIFSWPRDSQESRTPQFKSITSITWFSAVQFNHSVVSDSLWPHGLQHARPPCPSPTPGACSNSCPSSRWCHPAISSSTVPFSSCPQFLPASEFFPMSQLFSWGGQSPGVSASASFLPKNT